MKANGLRALLGLWLIFVPIALAVGAGFGSFLYITKQLAAPVVCPAQTRSAYVVAHVYDVADGGTSWDSWLYCEGADGTRHRQSWWAVAGTLAGYSWTLLALISLLYTLGRRRAEAKGWTSIVILALLAAALVVPLVSILFAPGCGTMRLEAFDAAGGEYLSGRGPELLRRQLRAAIPVPLKLESMLLRGTHVSLQAQNPDNPRFMDRYLLRQGSLEGPTPVQNPPASDFEHLFTLDQVPLDALPGALERCAQQIGKPLTHASALVDYRGNGLLLSVSCANPRLSTTITLDAAGAIRGESGSTSGPAH